MSKKRGIILGGYSGLSLEVLEAVAESSAAASHIKKLVAYAKDNVIFVKKAPHEWLFPQVSLTVHHGGSGTTNAALRAGTPTIITPVFADQYDSSFVVQTLGVGFGFQQKLQKISAKDLSTAIDVVADDPVIAAKAKKVGEEMRKECGCKAVVEEVERYWAEDFESGRLSAEIQEWKSATKKMKADIERKTLRRRILLGSSLAIAVIAIAKGGNLSPLL